MARIYMPRQREESKVWDMTVGSDEEGWIHPIGYCAGWHEWTDDEAKRLGFSLESCLRDQEPLVPHKAKFHIDGHSTSAEAATCYEGYILDTELHFRDNADEQKKCIVCDVWTTGRALLGHTFSKVFVLCPAHATRDNVVKAKAADGA